MDVQEYFTLYETRIPGKRTALRRTSFALRRAGVHTMEQLGRLWRECPEKLAGFRDIGAQSLAVIDEVIHIFEEKEQSV